MACLYEPAAEECGSVLDLDYGLPSPDESDDEHLKACTDIGIVVPSFCNKLREQTRPLFSLSLGAPSPSKQLREATQDRPKESRAKKRLFKGKQQPSAGVIERRYGYIPNPRWARSYTYAKPYDPVGVDDKDKAGIPGVVFRNTKTSVECDHSYQDSDFPSLNSTNSDRLQKSYSSMSSSRVIHTCENRDTSNCNYPLESPRHDSSTSFCVLKQNSFIENSFSPSTSTPVKRKETVSCSTLSPAVDSRDESIYTSDSSDSTSSSLRSHLSPDTQGLLERRLKALSPHSDFPALGSPRLCKTQDRSVNSLSLTATSPLVGSTKTPSSHVVSVTASSPCVNSVTTSSPHVISLTASSPCVNSVTTSSPHVISRTVSSHAAASSHVISKPQLGKNLDKNDNCSYSWADGLMKPFASNIGSQPLESTKCEVITALYLTDQVKPELSTSCLSENNSRQTQSKGWITSSNISSQHQLNTDKPEQPGFYRAQKLKGTKGRNQRQKHSDDSCGEDSSKNMSFFHSNNDLHHASHNKQFTSSSRGAITNSSAPRALTLESFMTPQKNTRKKNDSMNSRKDFDSFRNRFVEQLSVSPISPPKKVRPSPVKRIDSSKMNESLQSTQFGLSAKPVKECTGSQYQVQNNLEKHNISSNGSSVIVMEKSQEEAENIKNKMSTAPVFSLEKSLEVLELQNVKDVFEVENGSDVEAAVPKPDKEAELFWRPKQISKKLFIPSSTNNTGPPYSSCENDEDSDDTSNFISNFGRKSAREENNDELVDTSTEVDPSKVTHRRVLCKYARRYCHFIEEHHVPNIAIELYFIIQLLTCTHLDVELVRLLEKRHGKAYFNSMHNGVYFAVTVIKRLKHMFVMLETAYLQLLAANLRIQMFCPSLHQIFQQASANRKLKDNHVWSPVDYTTFNPPDDGAMSFPDTNTAHVFKCQRDNFYAFYRHYHDTDGVYEFRIENQIQYVYDGCTPEQNSIVNLMHLAKLFLDHLILCCVKQTVEQVDVLKMLQSKNHDEKLFLMLYEVFSKTSSNSSACPAPGFSGQQMFFRDFIETLSCPAFNEHLKSLLVFKILELNATDFSNAMDLHSVVTISDDQIVVRAERFTETVKTLCLMGKFLGYLTFLPYTSGGQSLALEQSGHLLAMREMIPLPLPLPLLLKQAFDNGHLSLTVPWVVEYLAMMDQMAPQLSIYAAVLRKLHFVHRYAWMAFYKQGHHLTGLLLVSCISWLFETPAIPEGYFYSFNDAEDVKQAANVHPFVIDRQKLVLQHLLSWCCPYLDQGQVLLTLFMLQQESSPISESSQLPESVNSEHGVLPVYEAGADPSSSDQPTSTSSVKVADIEQWLGISLAPHNQIKKETNIIDDEVVPAYVLTSLLARKEIDDIGDLEANLINNNPFLKFSVNVAVDLLCARVTDYAHKMILKLMVFEAKAEVRMQFHGVSSSTERLVIRDDIVTRAYQEAAGYSHRARESFKALCDRSLGKELPDLLLFLVSHTEDSVRHRVLCIANKLAVRRLEEWARVQLKIVFFSRVLISEADKCARTSQKYVALYPTDYSRKLEDVSVPVLAPSFTEHEQFSELIDKALSYGVWYVNALSPGVRPDDVHMTELIEDIIRCLERKLVTMDFAFAVMVNLLMHLIIQYIADAPQNWTQRSEDAFVRLCCLCKERTLEDSKVLVKKRRQLQVKVVNLLSAYSIQCLARSSNQRSLMVYSLLVFRLLISQLLPLETLCRRLTRVREHPHLDTEVKLMVNQILVKVLQLLYDDDTKAAPPGILANLLVLLKDLWQQCVIVGPEQHPDLVWTDLTDRLRTTFGNILEL